jgi:hypothetical protein
MEKEAEGALDNELSWKNRVWTSFNRVVFAFSLTGESLHFSSCEYPPPGRRNA